MGYNQEHKAVKIYDPRYKSEFCVSSKKLPLSLTMNADANKGQLCVAMDQLEKRQVDISSLHYKNMYKSVLQIKKSLKTSSFDKYNRIIVDV